MADDADGSTDGQDVESPEGELDDEYATLVYFSKYGEARRMLPWAEWTFREKANYCMDRIFLLFLVIFLIVLLGESGYKMWYVSNVKKITESMLDSVVFLFNWLFTQERHEELAEL